MNDLLLDAIADPFIASAENEGFNGVTASTLLRIERDPDALRRALSGLIREAKIVAVFSSHVVNMHIKRFPDAPIEIQVRLLASEPLNGTCLYPTAPVIETRIDVNRWRDRPFTKALVLAEPQLEFRAFELGVLERYVNDPRYVVHFNDYMGRMSIGDEAHSDEAHPERDKVYLQSFGLGFDDKRNPYVIAFLRYLSTLSPAHQQYWDSFSASGDIRMSEPYYLSSIRGEIWSNRSIRHAIVEEMRLVHELTEAIWGRSLFRKPPEGDVPIGLTSFLRPTTENFNRFVMALDKMLSDSIDGKFFAGKVPLEIETMRSDGVVTVRKKGTLKLLEEWLSGEIQWEDPKAFREIVIHPLLEVRQLRQKPAHTFTKDVFSAEYHESRRKLLRDVFNSLSNIRATFATHPNASHIRIPHWLDNGRIDVF